MAGRSAARQSPRQRDTLTAHSVTGPRQAEASGCSGAWRSLAGTSGARPAAGRTLNNKANKRNDTSLGPLCSGLGARGADVGRYGSEAFEPQPKRRRVQYGQAAAMPCWAPPSPLAELIHAHRPRLRRDSSRRPRLLPGCRGAGGAWRAESARGWRSPRPRPRRRQLTVKSICTSELILLGAVGASGGPGPPGRAWWT